MYLKYLNVFAVVLRSGSFRSFHNDQYSFETTISKNYAFRSWYLSTSFSHRKSYYRDRQKICVFQQKNISHFPRTNEINNNIKCQAIENQLDYL